MRALSPGARCTYALAGTRKYELPVGEVTLPGESRALGAGWWREQAGRHVESAGGRGVANEAWKPTPCLPLPPPPARSRV